MITLPKTKEEFTHFSLCYSSIDKSFIDHCVFDNAIPDWIIAQWFIHTLLHFSELVEIDHNVYRDVYQVWFASVFIGDISPFNLLFEEVKNFQKYYPERINTI